ncbi:hypothetical protein GGR51DRAFT_577501 [Nemania sp. FL0031]|nr:hypothetical protein GGR51DRAFT_577501 [Nemania sp. FL0031]
MDRHWERDSLQHTDLARLIISIHLIACPNLNIGGQSSPTNHWSLFFEMLGERSVRLDMVSGFGNDGLRGKIEVASKNYVCTRERVHRLSFQPDRAVTLEDIVHLIQRNGRQRYRFLPEWEGCRYWCYTIIQDLEAARIISPGSALVAEATLSNFYGYPSGSGVEPREIKAGRFYGR